jgi:dihydropyrimidine dehydrogenase (NAD+) subunit PreT
VAQPNPLAEHFPPLTPQQALVEANRCLYCYDAPCTHACPTHIDVPRFIKRIAADNLTGAARTIFEANLLGATCSRVCPVQELCEGACVLGKDHKPVMIGRLQRYAMDHAYRNGGGRTLVRAGLQSRSGSEAEASRGLKPTLQASHSSTGKSVAVVGSGPAALSCAGELARRGHSVTVFEKRELAGGLSTYGIIALREPIEAALAEVCMIENLGVRIETGRELGVHFSLSDLQACFDAVFLGVGLGAMQTMSISGEELIEDGLEYIQRSKLDPARLRIGRNVLVIGAGNTAIDCATVARRLGAEHVTMIYRRSREEMPAYPHEFEFAKHEGVEFRFLTQPVRVLAEGGCVRGLACIRMELGPPGGDGRRTPRSAGGEEFTVEGDQIVKAVGQEKPPLAHNLGLATVNGYVNVSADLETDQPGVFAGGDCIRVKNAVSTVMAVQDGRLAAAAIHRKLCP